MPLSNLRCRNEASQWKRYSNRQRRIPEITSESLPCDIPASRTADTVAAYAGPRYVIEEVADDPGYFHSIDTLSGDIVELHFDREDAQDHVDSLNNDDEDVDAAA